MAAHRFPVWNPLLSSDFSGSGTKIRIRRRLGGDLDGTRIVRTYVRLILAAAPAALAAGGVAYAITQSLGSHASGSLVALVAGAGVLLCVFATIAHFMGLPELNAMVEMIRGRLRR